LGTVANVLIWGGTSLGGTGLTMTKANLTAGSEAVHAACLISVQDRRARFLATGAMSGGALRKLMLTASVVAFASLHANPASAQSYTAGGGTAGSGNAVAIGSGSGSTLNGNYVAIGGAPARSPARS
jgi:hypothetical protein